MAAARKRILFTGYAPCHFLSCFPAYRRLAEDPRVEFWLSGGFRRQAGDAVSFSIEGFYDRFPVDPARVIPFDQAQKEDFDVHVSAHLSPPLSPRSAKKSVQLFHGVSFKNMLVREQYLTFSFICLAGRYHAEVYRKKGYIRSDGGRCLVTGFAKVDPLVDGSLDRAATLKKIGVDPLRPTVLYAPTGSRHNSMETMGPQVIGAIRAADRWNLLVKPHDHPKITTIDWFRELAPLESERVKIIRDLDVVPYIHAADLVLTDASSVAVEYTLMDRPIVFLDVPELFKDVLDRGGALDLDTYGRRIGVVVQKPEQVVDAIADSLKHPQREGDIRREMARHVFFDPGRATDRVSGVVLHAAGLAPALPQGVEVLRPASAPAASIQ